MYSRPYILYLLYIIDITNRKQNHGCNYQKNTIGVLSLFLLIVSIIFLIWSGIFLFYPTPLVLPCFGFMCVVNHAKNDDEVRIWPSDLVLKL